MHWSDEGIVLSARPHGENAAVVHLLTRGQGRHAGLVRGAQGRRARGVYQPGNLVAAQWSGRLAEHLGSYTCELVESYAARVLDDAGPLAALSAAAAVSERALPEREPHAACFEGFLALLDALTGDHWAEAYVRWELSLLAELGFGLDLSACAGGGANDHAVGDHQVIILARLKAIAARSNNSQQVKSGNTIVIRAERDARRNLCGAIVFISRYNRSITQGAWYTCGESSCRKQDIKRFAYGSVTTHPAKPPPGPAIPPWPAKPP